VRDFGADDDTTVTYHVNNNFYYNPHDSFKVPEWKDGYVRINPGTIIDIDELLKDGKQKE
jgi:hypothetical protein